MISFGDLYNMEKFLVLPPWEVFQRWHLGRKYEPVMRRGDEERSQDFISSDITAVKWVKNIIMASNSIQNQMLLLSW